MQSNIKKADPIFDYYQKELDIIYNETREFAKLYPKVAASLALGNDGSRDPQIERLLESFAFISARLKKDIDDEFPRIPEALISVLYPYLIRPVPCSSIIRMDITGSKGSIAAGFALRRDTNFFCDNDKGQKIQFNSCYDTKLFALDVQSVEVKKADEIDINLNHIIIDDNKAKFDRFLRINFKHLLGEIDFNLIDKFNIYLHGNKTQKRLLHEILTLSNLPFIKPIGFSSDQSMIPLENESHPAYRLLFEYFNYVDKFFFFEIDLQKAFCGEITNSGRLVIKGGANNKSDEFDILIPISDSIRLQGIAFDKGNIMTNCVPVINLFEATSEPINVDFKRTSYPVYGDSSLSDSSINIYAIKDVYSTDDISPSPKKIKPFFGYDHSDEENDTFWSVQYNRNNSQNKNCGAYLSFQGLESHGMDQVNDNTNPQKVVYADMLVSNAKAAEEISVDSEFSAETMLPADKIYNITPISSFKDGVSDGVLLWKLIAHLSINHMSLSNDNESLKSLKEIIKIYERSPKGMRQQEIDGIKELSTSLTTMHIGNDAWRGFVNGIKVKMRFDDDLVENGNALLFASVMNRFFALIASSNSFAKLEIYKENESNRWYTWQPELGTQDLL